MNARRQKLIKRLEALTNSDVYILFTGANSKFYGINTDLIAVYTKVIFERNKKRRKNATLILETSGGEPTTVTTLVDILKQCYEGVKGYAVSRCYSAGTIGMFTTDEMCMTKYAFCTPIDLQIFPDNENEYLPLIAYFNTYVGNGNVSERELRFEERYQEDYLSILTRNQYSQKSLKPLIAKHCVDKTKVDCIFGYLNGGAGLHNVKLSRTQLINLGVSIKEIPSEEESILVEIVDTYVNDTNMLVSSMLLINGIEEITNAYFETFKNSYVHYEIYKSDVPAKVEEVEANAENSDKDASEDDVEEKAIAIIAKRKVCIECGWRKDID